MEALDRINNYIDNPNFCLYCNKPILPKDKQRLYDVKIKKFCSRSCSNSYSNIHRVTCSKYTSQRYKLKNLTDEEIFFKYSISDTLKEFLTSLGYTGSYHMTTLPKILVNKCDEIGLDLDKFRPYSKDSILSLTKGELFTTKGYQKARAIICKQARSIYKQSNKIKKCAVCQYDKHYEVAHIVSVSNFKDNSLISEINNIDNLVALCPNHHWEYDNGCLELKI